MNRNPYAPPESAVTEPVTPTTRGKRPWQVEIAVMLLWIGYAFLCTLLVQFASRQDPVFFSGWISRLLSWVPALAFLTGFAVVISKIYRGRNWARMALSAFVLYQFVKVLVELRRLMSFEVLPLVIEGIQAALLIVPLCFLFTKSARTWFKR